MDSELKAALRYINKSLKELAAAVREIVKAALRNINKSLKDLISAVSGIGKPMGSPVRKNVSVVTKILPAELSEEGNNCDEQ